MKLYPKVTWYKANNTYEVDGMTLTADQVYALQDAYNRATKEGGQSDDEVSRVQRNKGMESSQ